MNSAVRVFLYTCAGIFAFLPSLAHAQVESNFTAGGGLRVGYSSTICNSAIVGALRYNSAVTGSIDFCNGTNWLNAVSGGSIDGFSDARTDYVTDHNMFMGRDAGKNIQTGGQYNIFMGALSGGATTTGTANIAVGYNALGNNLSGNNNIAIGVGAHQVPTANSDVIAIGWNAHTNVTGNENVVIGYNAAPGGVRNRNVAIGLYAMIYSRGDNNVAVGRNVMAETAASPGSNDNVAIGDFALTGINAPGANVRNVVIGRQAGNRLGGAVDNVLFGRNAGSNISSGSRNIIIGSSIAAAVATDSDKLNIGSLIYGDLSVNKYVGLNKAVPAYTLDVSGDIAFAGMTVDVSDGRKKNNIESLPPQIAKIQALAPVSFVMKDDPDKNIEYGLIAQDVTKIYPELVKVAHDADQSLSMNYVGLIAPMVKSVQERQLMLEEQQKRIDHLRDALEKRSRKP